MLGGVLGNPRVHLTSKMHGEMSSSVFLRGAFIASVVVSIGPHHVRGGNGRNREKEVISVGNEVVDVVGCNSFSIIYDNVNDFTEVLFSVFDEILLKSRKLLDINAIGTIISSFL